MSIIFSSDIVLTAYTEGFFPMADDRYGEIYWHSPDPRAIFPLKDIKPSRKVRQAIKKNDFIFTVDQRFEDVITLCAERDNTWINDEIIETYTELHENGHAHSIEVYKDSELAGGLYGVSINGAFFGESMFNLVPNAAKAAFYYLIEHLKTQGFLLLDSQYLNPFTEQLGAVEISKNLYLYLLHQALQLDCRFMD